MSKVGLYVIAFLTMAIIVIPLTFSVLGGFRTSQQLSADPVGLPSPWVWENYDMLIQSGDFWRQVWNSTLSGTPSFSRPKASLFGSRISRTLTPRDAAFSSELTILRQKQ